MKITQTFFTKDLMDYLNIDDLDNKENISDFRKVNFFIGPNNSGKSRILRAMFYGHTDSLFSDGITLSIEETAIQILSELNSKNITKYGKVSKGFIEQLTNGLLIKSDRRDFDIDDLPRTKLSYSSDEDRSLDHLFDTENDAFIFTKNLEILNNKIFSEFAKCAANAELVRKRPEFIYIPIIRGTRPLAGSSNNDIYVERTKKDYFSNIEGSKFHSIFGGDNLYKEVEDLLLGSADKRSLIFEYEAFLSKHFFHKKVTIIPQRGEDVLLIKIGDEKERLIYDLGDGVQAVILLTFPIFIRKGKNCMFFIEEPELNLHPSLQRRILNCLSVEFPDHQYFISTHSNHFLEGLSEYENVALFSFKKSFTENKFHVQKLTSIKTDILDSLGVRNSSVLMSNCTIWVEGITDRLYIQKFLEVYSNYRTEQDELSFTLFKEDQHYSFVEYAGSNITHWDFGDSDDENINALYVSKNIFLIADSDCAPSGKISKPKKERFAKLSDALDKNFHLIEVKEIENTLTQNVIHNVVADFERKDLKDIDYIGRKPVTKNNNLGKWIEKSFEPLKKLNYTEGNTISRKVSFCKKAIRHINDIEDLSDEAIILCEKIYSFIKGNNSEYIEES